MAYVVVAAYVTAETNVGAGRARVDLPYGTILPADVPAEDINRLTASGAVEQIANEVEDLTGETEPAKPSRRKA